MQQRGSQANIDYQIKISAISSHMDEYSKPNKQKFLYCYQILIKNEGQKPIQLLNRHWIIIDGNGHREEVKGAGVIGQQPRINPGEEYKYFSFCNLNTNFGTMEGEYEMIGDDNQRFLIPIPRFYLAENLYQIPQPQFRRGQILKHKTEGFIGVVADYDMYFMNDESLYDQSRDKPAKDKPWYYLLVNQSNSIAYVGQESLELDEVGEIEHPLIDFFFDGIEGKQYIRNSKTWEDLKSS